MERRRLGWLDKRNLCLQGQFLYVRLMFRTEPRRRGQRWKDVKADDGLWKMIWSARFYSRTPKFVSDKESWERSVSCPVVLTFVDTEGTPTSSIIAGLVLLRKSGILILTFRLLEYHTTIRTLLYTSVTGFDVDGSFVNKPKQCILKKELILKM